MPDMPHSFDCEATDWLRGIWSSCKKFALGVSVVILDGASVLQILKDVVSSIPTMFLKRYVISTFCAVDRVDLVCGTC